MPDPISAAVGGTIGSALIGKSAASKASKAQVQSAQMGVDVQQRQFEQMQQMLQPYVSAGYGASLGLVPYAQAGLPAFQQQQALIGLAGPEAQRQAIAAIEGSPEMAALTQQGEEAILARASATGGLRGGNVQGALAQFRPQILSQLLNQQYGRLGGISATGLGVLSDVAQRGQAAAAGVGTAGQATAGNVAQLLAQQGQARAGSALAAGQAFGSLAQLPAQIFGMRAGGGLVGASNPFGGLSGGNMTTGQIMGLMGGP